MAPPLLRLTVEESAGISRRSEPVTVGVPMPRGVLREATDVTLIDETGAEISVQTQALSRWADGSVRWLLADFQASVKAWAVACFDLTLGRRSSARLDGVTLHEAADALQVQTGAASFVLDRRVLRPFAGVCLNGVDIIGGDGAVALVDTAGRRHVAHLERTVVETLGPLRTTIALAGRLRAGRRKAVAELLMRLSFYAGSAGVDLQLTIRNPRAARHPGGFWDLGDEGSMLFREFAVELRLAGVGAVTVEWTERPDAPPTSRRAQRFELYQDSSGGPNWAGPNHANRHGVSTTQFAGYRTVVEGARLQQGLRASPIVALRDGHRCLAAAIEGFWQNFPKAIEVEGATLRLALFPRQSADVHELQGGEQKTHRIFLQVASGDTDISDLGWTEARLIPIVPRDWYGEAGVISGLSAGTGVIPGAALEPELTTADRIVQTAVEGDHSFFAKRETIDEYGWRHFGEVYADHEAVLHPGLIAHYNNQYDVVLGASAHYARSGDLRWFMLMRDLARHVVDIDIYHTREDRPAFNGGLFWHTEHYMDAATATHRSYSAANVGDRRRSACGGGPSNEHNYTTGLLTYYYLTGDLGARDAVLGLAQWVLRMDDEARGIMTVFDRRPTGMASMTVSSEYHGPGRGAGNSINALMDGFAVSGDRHYLAKGEELIRRCIHPAEDIDARELHDVEHRWSYTVFLQVLGKYLDLKVELGEADAAFFHARESLLAYARWMAEHERPYRMALDRVEIPTETWPAQDIRKANVFRWAAKYAPDADRMRFVDKAADFVRHSVRDLMAFPTWYLTRPVAIMMTNAFVHDNPVQPVAAQPWRAPTAVPALPPSPFVPRFHELRRVIGATVGALRRVRSALRRAS
jgi:hypothetical protein